MVKNLRLRKYNRLRFLTGEHPTHGGMTEEAESQEKELGRRNAMGRESKKIACEDQ